MTAGHRIQNHNLADDSEGRKWLKPVDTVSAGRVAAQRNGVEQHEQQPKKVSPRFKVISKTGELCLAIQISK